MRIEDYIGHEVDVEPYDGDAFQHGFRGTVVSVKYNTSCEDYLQVRDQDSNVWDCSVRQCSLTSPPPRAVEPLRCILLAADIDVGTVRLLLPEGTSAKGAVIGQTVYVVPFQKE